MAARSKKDQALEKSERAIETVEADWRRKLDLVKSTVADELTNEEFDLFVHRANHLQLDPLQRQIYAWIQKENGRRKLVFMVGIDGLRLVAHRTKKYVPGTIEYGRDEDGRAFATATVNIIGPDGAWHKVSRTAYFNEFAKTYPDTGKPKGNWAKMPRLMLGKCAEALALRTAFPDVMGNVYTPEEMDQASNVEPVHQAPRVEPSAPSSGVSVVDDDKGDPGFKGTPDDQKPSAEPRKAKASTKKKAPVKKGDAVTPKGGLADKATDETKDAIAKVWRLKLPDGRPVWTQREIADQSQRLAIDLSEANFRSMLLELTDEADARMAKAAGDAPADEEVGSDA